MKRETAKRLLDARNACADIERYTTPEMQAALPDRRSLFLILYQLIEIAGEALNAAYKEDPDLGESIPSLRQVVDMRNRLIHGYDSVDDSIVWIVATERIPALRERLDALLRDAPPTQSGYQ
jgi:uncharacterized protein with HEPN domain